MTNKIVLIDLSSIFWACWHSSVNDEVSMATSRTVAGVKRAAGDAEHVAICCDEGRSWRKDAEPSYKANRPEKDHAALDELRRCKERLKADGFLLWGADGFEADDIIATACKTIRDNGGSAIVASADKDMLQLVTEDIQVLSTNSWIMLGPGDVKAKFGVFPEQMRDYLSLVGDASDNIKGIAGVGAKRAAELLSRFGNLGTILAKIDEGIDEVATPSVLKGFKEGLDGLKIAQKLISLREDAPIKFSEIFEKREQVPLREQEQGEDMDIDDMADDAGPPQPPQAPIESPPANEMPQPIPTALVPSRSVSFEQGLEPTSLGVAHKLAVGLYNSRLYSRYNNPESIWAVIIRGREMGMGALTALDCFHVIENKPAMGAHLMIARSMRHPDCEYFQFLGGDDKYAEYETKNKRNPKPTKLRYTIEQAEKAGLLRPTKTGRPSQWNTRRAEMLRKTCGVQLARLEYPDATLGLMAIEEMDGE